MMAITELIHDVEGILGMEKSSDKAHYMKQLSLETAWNTDDFNDLTLPENSCVQEVRQKFEEKTLTIQYVDEIELSTYESLRKIIATEKDFGVWRILVFMDQICSYLHSFHVHELYQLVIHPARIAIHKEQFIFLPTLSGVLPGIPELLKGKQKDWIYFIAPEILRKRGLDQSDLESGDIYSLGRLFRFLRTDMKKLPELKVPTKTCTGVVEQFHYDLDETFVPIPEELFQILDKMCDPDPSERPDLQEIIDNVRTLSLAHRPSSILRSLMDKKEYAIAEAEFLSYAGQRTLSSFADLEAELIYCELQACKSPPDFPKAISHLDKTIRIYADSFEAYLLKGDLYARFTSHNQHVLLSVSAYQHACSLSNWKPEIQQKLFNAALKLDDLNKIIDTTSVIPHKNRIPGIYLLWAKSHLRFHRIDQAWDEIITYLEITGFSEDAYRTALEIALKMEPVALLKWKHDHKAEEIPNLKTALSVVFNVHRNGDLAKQYLEEAITLKQ